MNVLIVDDEPLARDRIREMLKKETSIETVAEAANGAEAIKYIKRNSPDVVFLDIQMPDLDGFQVLEKLGAKIVARIPAIIFVTAYDQHALRAFEVHALDYLLKPFDRERFRDAIKRAKAHVKDLGEGSPNDNMLKLLEELHSPPEYLEWLTVKKNERIKLFKTDDIHSIEAQGNYVLLKFAETSELMRETMDGIETQLDPKKFVRIHRSAIVQVNKIKELQVWRRGEYRIVMQSGNTFTLSRGYRHRFDDFLKKGLA